MSTLIGNYIGTYAGRFSGGFRGGMMGRRGFACLGFGGCILLILLVVAAYFIFKNMQNKKEKGKSYDESLLILNNRLAEGEINEEEYKIKKELLINDEKKIKDRIIAKEPMEVLNARFAKGEISEEEYKTKKELLLKK
ncbi:MAG: SHOCT domain-containing protein [Bacillota bacterium]|nr:SHOCT domain-containing protein [Bacillota bacterium]